MIFVWLVLLFNLATIEDVQVEIYSPVSGEPRSGGEGESPRVKRYRVDFLSKVIIPGPAEEIDPVIEEIPEIDTPVIEPVPEVPEVVETPSRQTGTDEVPAVEDIAVEQPETYDGPVKEFHGIDEQPGFYFPELDFTDVYGNPVDDAYIHNLERYEGTVIYIVDVSRPGGFQTLTDWAEMWGAMLKIPGVVEPPNLISFSVAVADPYSPQARYLADSLRRKVEKENLLDVPRPDGTVVRHTHVPDPQNRILDKLGIAEMEAPIVYLLDGNGGVMVRLEGRLRDMGERDVDATLSRVKDLWGMSDWEVGLARVALLTYLSKLRGED
jgi:hypothetical protein